MTQPLPGSAEQDNDLVALAVLWLVGACLRMTILAVPPLMPLLHAELHLSEGQVGLLSSLPSLMFALAAIPGAFLVARFGIGATLLAGLALNALASAARGLVPHVDFLYATTALMAAGVAVTQPALPPLVRNRFPRRIGFATAVYTNGLLVGEILSASLTRPLVLPLVGQHWRGAVALWALPVLLTAVLVLAYGRHLVPKGRPAANARQWIPDWKHPLIWRLGFLLGGVNAMYFVANAFLPDFATAAGHPELIESALTALNVAQLPASFLMLALAGRLATRRWAYVATASLSLLSVLGIIASRGEGIVVWCAVLGFSNSITLILAFALPSLLCAPADVPRTSAGMFTISYGWAMAVSIFSGQLWDWTRSSLSGIAPLALCAVITAGLACTLRLGGHDPRAEAPPAFPAKAE
ncbi:CynX/NimT family MFS transporter [Thiomonas sp. FB-6]|uniref:MFS transporter n=1 Tax=Thiomonas sp. FB-6 TaxID=1158291 RepID=UPI00036319B6|nr:MFS transporter [Thiomonas sp. FB-6]